MSDTPPQPQPPSSSSLASSSPLSTTSSTSRPAVTPPNSIRTLDSRLRNITRDDFSANRLRRALANTILGQLMPDGAVKGGTAMKLRLGQASSRFTPDFDAARAGSLSAFLDTFERSLAVGWGGFTGRLVAASSPRPAGVPADYVMRPYDVKLHFKGRSWLTVRLEVGHDEIGDTDHPEMRIPADLIDLFAQLGLPEPGPVPVLAIDHQIAQKLHACSAPGSERAHDLVDLQLLIASEDYDLALVGQTARRLFRSRRGHEWPPTVTAGPTWEGVYAAACEGLDVNQEMTAAVVWTNDLIARIDAA